ncbi:hypothetical protein [Halorhodospira abdelmalekii]|nr:hypothetical protein [Halorhodospira abdelmalekii]
MSTRTPQRRPLSTPPNAFGHSNGDADHYLFFRCPFSGVRTSVRLLYVLI